MRRREFIAVSTAAFFCSPGVQAQAGVRRITVLSAASDPSSRMGEVLKRLRELGHVEGKNIVVDFRSADGQLDRLPSLAEAISRNGATDVILAESTPAAIAAHRATRTIPIVALVGVDPVGSGLASSLARPGGNVTGVAIFADEANAKRVELVHELAPKAVRLAAVLAIYQGGTANTAVVVEVGNKLGLSVELIVVHPDRLAEDLSLTRLAKYDALLFVPDVLLASRRDEIVNLIAQSKKPAIFSERQWVDKGGLASFGPDLREVLRHLGTQLARVLNGQNVGDLPFERPTRFEFRLNMRTARDIGTEISPSLLARADEVIE
jgi:putative ABC transport system substrate-binding protein